ncbi:hypothetical protein EJ04DRAFT_492980 [Polyplosphaeria fusca]|uniref:Uncharacterized protein n=1 Tax=Polyplosphaeria fusca TaxID=682080 RepID=A0A9P4V1P1_9PLEO|nr:hypothetical protein EJ04DRAFT_492980 [Polyplosphaeria fusca]
MPNLGASKYAPSSARDTRTPAETLAETRAQRLINDKEKASRLLSRLRWKAETLIMSYNRAIELQRAEHYDTELRFPYTHGMENKQSSSHFHADFFEYYTLLERFITLSLSILGVQVPEGLADVTRAQNVNALKWVTNPSLQQNRPLANHAFHANLLAALDEPEGPLYAALGAQDVRIQLGTAKEWRNKWKDDSEKLSGASKGSTSLANKTKASFELGNLELHQMLQTILHGCEKALQVVQAKQNADPNTYTAKDFENMQFEEMELVMDDVPVEYMDDAMDLD